MSCWTVSPTSPCHMAPHPACYNPKLPQTVHHYIDIPQEQIAVDSKKNQPCVHGLDVFPFSVPFPKVTPHSSAHHPHHPIPPPPQQPALPCPTQCCRGASSAAAPAPCMLQCGAVQLHTTMAVGDMTISSWWLLGLPLFWGLSGAVAAATACAVAAAVRRTTGCRGWWPSTGSRGLWNCRTEMQQQVQYMAISPDWSVRGPLNHPIDSARASLSQEQCRHNSYCA